MSFLMETDIEPGLELLQEYLNSTPVASRLVLLRNIQLNSVLRDNQELLQVVIDAMINLKLMDEANRLADYI
ncbi:hypothetical protein [Metabacillus litoralis]|uniref:hypothetical protein n=1 Tax=Metabacillus litoralis TaxID=152268 RepID=UPI000EF5D53F|nr:hypothetical protein [Metabacillus litoralis]